MCVFTHTHTHTNTHTHKHIHTLHICIYTDIVDLISYQELYTGGITVFVCVRVCACERERERDKERRYLRNFPASCPAVDRITWALGLNERFESREST